MDQVGPLVGLQADEERAAERRQEEKHPGARPVSLSQPLERLHHRHARADEQEGHRGRQVDTEDVERPGPVTAGGPHRAVAGEKRAEPDGVARQEDPHAELSPALGCQRGLGRFHRPVHRGYVTHVVSLRISGSSGAVNGPRAIA